MITSLTPVCRANLFEIDPFRRNIDICKTNSEHREVSVTNTPHMQPCTSKNMQQTDGHTHIQISWILKSSVRLLFKVRDALTGEEEGEWRMRSTGTRGEQRLRGVNNNNNNWYFINPHVELRAWKTGSENKRVNREKTLSVIMGQAAAAGAISDGWYYYRRASYHLLILHYNALFTPPWIPFLPPHAELGVRELLQRAWYGHDIWVSCCKSHTIFIPRGNSRVAARIRAALSRQVKSSSQCEVLNCVQMTLFQSKLWGSVWNDCRCCLASYLLFCTSPRFPQISLKVEEKKKVSMIHKSNNS